MQKHENQRSLGELKKIYQSFSPDIDTNAVEKGNKVQMAWHEEKFEAACAKIRKANLKKGAKLLDLACGSGPLTMKLAKEFPEYDFLGCDFNEQATELANRKAKAQKIGNVSFHAGPAEKLPFKDNNFEMVFALDALDHFLKPQKALNEIFRVSTKGSSLMLCVGNYRSFWPLLEIIWDKLGSGRDYLETHLTHFNRKLLVGMAESTGFCEIKVYTLHNVRPFLSVLTKKYPGFLERFMAKKCLGMTLFLTAQKS
jgi:ubiquinone/menaquinone biosynthesis C-methylase UbiE